MRRRDRARQGRLRKLTVLVVSAATAVATGLFTSGSTALAATFQFTPGLPLLDGGGANTGAAEPSLRVDTEGHVYVDGPVGVPTGGCPFWLIHPGSQESNGHVYKYQGKFDTQPIGAGGGDCDIATGGLAPTNNFDNLAVSSLSLANVTVNQSSDGGTTWHGPANTANPVSSLPLDDRQWQAADTGIGENYLTVHDLASDNIQIATSIDGGYTYVAKQPAISTTVGTCGQTTGSCALSALQDNHFGNIVVNKATHQLYTVWVAPQTTAEAVAGQSGPPNEHEVNIASGTPVCAGACAPGNPIVSIAWTDHIVYVGPTGTDYGQDFPSIAIDAAGGIYTTWSDTAHIYMSHSATPDTDGTWSIPTLVDQGTSHSNMFPWIVGGRAGTVDEVWYSSTFLATCGAAPGNADDSAGVSNSCHNTWTTQFAQSTDSGASFTQVAASPVIHKGAICNQGLTCATGTRTLLDFFQVDLDPAGAANIAYATDAASPGSAQITYTRQCLGPSATASAGINYGCGALEAVGNSGPPPPTCDGTSVATDPAGDVNNPTGTPNPPSGTPGNTEQADITNVGFSSDASTITTTLTIANLPTNPPAPIAGTADTYYYVVWTGPDGNTYATLDSEPSTGPTEFTYGKFDPSTNQLTTSNTATGTITPGSPGKISVTVPRTGVGNPTIPVSSGAPAAHDPYALVISGEGALGTGLVFVQPDDRAPNQGYGADWSVCGSAAIVPESPATALLAAGGTAAVMVYVVAMVRRRRPGQPAF